MASRMCPKCHDGKLHFRKSVLNLAKGTEYRVFECTEIKCGHKLKIYREQFEETIREFTTDDGHSEA
jgi:hypothetical protein